MTLKPLYKLGSKVLVGLDKDFYEVCVLDGLVIEVDLDARQPLTSAGSGLYLLKHSSYTPIRKNEKSEYIRLLRKKLKKKQLRKIEEELEFPSREAVESLQWVPERLENGNGQS